jgi:hypothetical protein
VHPRTALRPNPRLHRRRSDSYPPTRRI